MLTGRLSSKQQSCGMWMDEAAAHNSERTQPRLGEWPGILGELVAPPAAQTVAYYVQGTCEASHYSYSAAQTSGGNEQPVF